MQGFSLRQISLTSAGKIRFCLDVTVFALFVIGMLITIADNAFAVERPNIVLIVSDDQGYNDLGLLGNGIITPHLDRLAAEGTRLTDFYVAWPACTPSRAALLTGRYPQRNGVYDMIRNEAPDYGHKYTASEYAVTFERIGGMDTQEVILPRLLAPSGYVSGIYGKWDLGSLKRFLPTSRGFDDFYGFVNTGIDYYTHERYGVPSMFRNLSPTTADRGTYCTELFQRESLRFLDEHAGKTPFFLYVPFNAPHNSSALDPTIRSSVQAPPRYKAMYPDVDPEFRSTDKHRYQRPATVTTPDARRRDYRAAVTYMDEAIGSILAKLEQTDTLDNTIIIFFSDNGGSSGADNSPLRGHKAQLWEGGIRVPCLVRWPGGNIPAARVCGEFLTSLEIVPSLLAATSTPTPKDLKLDGFDWWPTLRGESSSPRSEMFWRRKDDWAVRAADWKYVSMGGKTALFDLNADISERTDLTEKHPEVVREMKQRLSDWDAEMDAAPPRGPFRDF
ncbi:sulfatase-like hydrolase/transferase [Stieleria varia]|uniref:Arylsulfatase n=1 Tax=Stieleria varia TaxID=2528005 RepID=A0A5C6A533_9BACT|nr:sulfatase-like hydrolase/transferase [Stieleria varia]TWT94408.1 Arylsulfatase [Stieleria varia]